MGDPGAHAEPSSFLMAARQPLTMQMRRTTAPLLLMLILMFITQVTATSSSTTSPLTALRVDEQIVQRLASPFAAAAASASVAPSQPFYREYDLQGLEPNGFYEVRLSYIGTLPYSFRVLLLPSSASRSSARQLLDVEKAMFRTDERGRPEGCSPANSPECASPRVRVEALFNGVTDQIEVMQQDILFAIVLEKLLPGGVPIVAVKLLVVLLVAFALARWRVWPYIGRVVQTESQRLSLHSTDDSRADVKVA